MSVATMRLALLITGLLALKPSPDAPDKDLKPGIGLGSHRSPNQKYITIIVKLVKSFFWYARQDSNLRPTDSKSGALSN